MSGYVVFVYVAYSSGGMQRNRRLQSEMLVSEEFVERGFVLDCFRPVWEHSAHVRDAGWDVVGGPTVGATCFIVVVWVYLSSVKETKSIE